MKLCGVGIVGTFMIRIGVMRAVLRYMARLRYALPVTETFLTFEDAANALPISSYTFRQWLKTGKLRGAKIGSKWRVPNSALAELAKGTNGA